MLEVGTKAPEFTLPDKDGNPVSLSEFLGKKVVLYFYPKDNTPGCTAEACSLRDHYSELQAQGYEVVGVSVDSEASHRKFREKHALPFTLIADTDKALVQEMGVWGEKSMCGRKYMGTLRTTFVTNEQGTITQVLGPKQVQTKTHGQQLLDL